MGKRSRADRKARKNRQPGQNPQCKNDPANTGTQPPDHDQPERPHLQCSVTCQAPQDKEQQAAERQYWGRKIRVAKWLNWITLIASIAALVGLWFLYDQSKIATAVYATSVKSYNTSVDTLHQSQRPWVSVSDIAVGNPILQYQFGTFAFEFRIGLKNTGASTAIRGFLYAIPASGSGSSVGDAWDSSCKTVDKQKRGRGERYQTGFVLAPGETKIFTQGSDSDGISFPKFNNLKFWVLGCVKYDDGFGIEHHTRFCFVGRPDIGGDSKSYRFTVCDTAEEAD